MPPGLLVEFPIADIGQRIEIPELMECIHDDIVNKIDESDVIGVQVIPARWPRKVQLLCAHQAAKDCLMIQGLDILGRHIELNEPGRGVIKVIITGAPLDMQNDVIKTWLESYATITEFRNEHMTIKGRRSNWRSGTRHAFVFNIKETIPPAAKLPYNEGEVNISVWHYGQMHIKCKFCHEIVPKGHECDKAPTRRCYNCGGEDHIRANCQKGKNCYKCGGTNHIARYCPQNDIQHSERNVPNNNAQEEMEYHSAAGEIAVDDADSLTDSVLLDTSTEQHDDSKLSATPTSTMTEPAVDSEQQGDIAHMEAILIGGSNCRNIQIKGDENITLNVTNLTQGGLRIREAAEKLEECSKEHRQGVEAVVVHVGTCDFPANDLRTEDENYLHYVELLNSITTTVPKAKILLSSVLPRAGHGNTNINKQIEDFNKKLSKLASEEDNVYFQDNDSFFVDNQGHVIKDLYRQSEKSGVHINIDGQMKLGMMLSCTLKEMHFRNRLEDEYLFTAKL